jgi:hypothetical protein
MEGSTPPDVEANAGPASEEFEPDVDEGGDAGDGASDRGGDTGSGSGTDSADPVLSAQAVDSDSGGGSRSARPETFEHAFGAGTHPAQPAASDPRHRAAAPGAADATDNRSPEPPAADPSITPEQ